MSYEEQVGDIFKDLKRLARRGPTRECLASLYSLIGRCGLDELHTINWESIGDAVRNLLFDSIDSFDQRVYCKIRWLEPEEFREGLFFALGLATDTAGSAEDRYIQTALLLRMPYAYHTWRRDTYSGILFEALARHIVERTA